MRFLFSVLGMSCVIASFSSVMAQVQSFTNFGTFNTVEATNVGVGRFAETSFPWFEGDVHSPLPGWDANLKWDWVANYAGFTAPEDNPFLFSSDFTSTSVVTAKDENGETVGTLSMAGIGAVAADGNDDAVFVDEFSALVYNPYVLTETYQVTEGTGIYEHLKQVGDWSILVNGRSAHPLYSDQDSRGRLAANATIQNTSTFVIEGQYEIAVPELDLDTAFRLSTIDKVAIWSPAIGNDNLEMTFVDYDSADPTWRLATAARQDTNLAWGHQDWIEGEGSTWERYSHDRANITADGLTMIFASDIFNPNSGGWDVWQSTRPNKDSPWSVPESVDAVNTTRSERAVDLSSDELTLYLGHGFDSYGPIWMSTRESLDDEWSEQVPVPGMENVNGQYPTVTSDELTLVYAINTVEMGRRSDLWIATRDSKEEPFANHRELLSTANIDSFAHFGPDDELYFVQNAIQSSTGWDVWRTGDELEFAFLDTDTDGNLNAEDADRICSIVFRDRYIESADLNSDGTVNMDDLTILIDQQGVVAGDLDFDSDVDFEDFLVLSDFYGRNRRAWSRGDFDCDGVVGFPDFLAMSANYGHGTTDGAQEAASVPEPSGIWLALVAVGAAFSRRRSRV